MADDLLTFRHRVTGELGSYGARMGKLFEHILEEVEPNATPPAPQPDPQEDAGAEPGASTDSVGSADPNQEDAQ